MKKTLRTIFFSLFAILSMCSPAIVSAQSGANGWAGDNPSLRSGNCPFFDLTANPTSPTCNGFNNGIASVIVSGGVGPFTYNWIGGPSTPSWNNVGAGTYTVIVFDQGQGGAPCNIDVFVNEPGPLTVFAMNATSPTCFGACNGAASPIVIGGAGGYSYSWNSGESGFSANQLCNPFTLTVTDANGCVLDTTYTFADEPQEIVIDAVVTPIACSGENSGAIALSVSGGTPQYTYSWSGPGGFSSSDANISNLAPGDYTILVTDLNGCESESLFTITEPAPLILDALITNNECAGDSLGAISATPGGGTPPYSLAWSGPNGFTSTQTSISELLSGNYTATLTDSLDCELIQEFTVSEPAAIVIVLNASDILCAGEATGSISTDVSGGDGNFTYQWTGPNGFSSSDQNISELAPGPYTLLITDGAGCTQTATATLNEPDEITTSGEVANLTCAGSNDGAIILTISGGTPDYTFAWSGANSFSSSSQNITALSSGTYLLTVTDANGCVHTNSFEVSEPPLIVLTASITNNLCAGDENGAINLTVSGGTPGFSYSWTGPNGFTSDSEDISALPTGSYAVVVSDANGCEQADVFNVQENPPIELSITASELTCPEDIDGSILLEITGGTPDYSVAWSGPAGFSSTAQNLTGLSQGTYSVVVIDANGCETTGLAEINATDTMVVNTVVTPVSCFGEANGAVLTSVTGGLPDYSFAWTGPNGFASSEASITGLISGTYQLTVTDANNCEVIVEVTIDEPALIEVSGTATDLTCNGLIDGSIDIEVSGGTPPYQYQWSGPGGFNSDEEDLFSLEEGIYTLLVTDSLGCTQSAEFSLATGIGPEIDAIVTNANCASNDDGSIETSVSGGTPPYTYNWSGPDGFNSSESDIFGLTSGTYELTLTDSAGCITDAAFSISNPSGITITGDVSDLLCAGDNSGAIDITLDGVSGPITIVWSGPDGFSSNDQSISGLSAGSYTIVIIDEQNCITQEIFTVNEPALLTLNVQVTPPDCNESNGMLTAVVSGGTAAADYTFLWTDEFNNIIGNSATLADLGPGTYTISVSDDNGCTLSETIVLLDSDIAVDAVLSPPSCNGIEDGSIEVTVSGGIPPYTLNWSGPDGFTSDQSLIENLAAGDYLLSVTDSAGCLFTTSFVLTAPEAISIQFNVENPQCNDTSNGSISATVTGGTPGYSFIWTGPNGFAALSQNIADLVGGTYQLEVTDSLGCTTSATANLTAPDSLSIEASQTNIICGGDQTGAIAVTITGGTPGYVISWSGPDGFTSDENEITNLAAGIYSLSGVDANLCPFSASYTITENDPLAIVASILPVSCADDQNGEITISVSGGSGPIAILWNGPDGFSSSETTIDSLAGGTYNLSITDSLGCGLDTSFVIDAPLPLQATINITQPECLQNNGALTAQISGGTSPYAVQWLDGNNTLLGTDTAITGLFSGVYSVFVSDANGCEFSQELLLTDLGGEIIADISNLICFGDNTGAIDVTVNDAVPPFTYAWTGPSGFSSADEDIAGIAAGTYTLVVVDSLGCITAASFDVSEPEQLAANPEISQVSCFGSDGAINLNLSGGISPYDISWSGPNGFTATGEVIDSLDPGLYVAQISDANGCELLIEFNLTETDPLEISLSAQQISCNGDQNGTITAEISGGLPGYEVVWAGPGVFLTDSLSLSNLGPGFYEIQVTDANGCTAVEGITITEPDELTATLSITPTTCELADGSAIAEASGGTIVGDYTYTWLAADSLPIGSGNSITGLAPGLYFVIITDDNGCTFSSPVIIQDENVLLDAAITNPGCATGNDGAIELEVIGGTPPFSFSWTGPGGFTSTNQNISGLVPGTYIVLVTDSLNCVYADQYDLEIPVTLFAETDITPITCSGDANGGIAVTISGGATPYEFSWSGPDGFESSDAEISDLAAGTYTLTVTDSLLCATQISVDLVNPAPISADFSITNNLCASDTSGSILTTVSGGHSPYSFQWIGPEGFSDTLASISNLATGFYEVLITDSAGCEEAFEAIIESTPAITASFEVIPPLCFGDSNGSAIATAQGGTPGYSYSWSGPGGFTDTLSTVDSLSAGNYLLTITDSIGCQITDTLEIIQPDSIIASLNAVNALCFDSNDGEISAAFLGGTAPFETLWSGPDGFSDTTATIAGLLPGEYNLTYFDSNGCSGTLQAVITAPDSLTVSIISITDALCNTDNSGAIEAAATGGTSPYDFSWSGPDGFTASGSGISELLPGDYTLLVTDSNNCESSISTVVDFTFEILAEAGADTSLCEETLPLWLTGSSVNAENTQWTDSLGNPLSLNDSLLVNLPPGNYTFFFTATNGLCTYTDSVLVVIYPQPDANAGADQDIVEGEEAVLGGSPTSTSGTGFLWIPSETLSDSTAQNPIAMPQTTTNYVVFVTDLNGCSNSDTTLITVIPDIFVPTGISPNGDGANDTWVISYIEQFPLNVVEIYNRWGDLLHRAEGYDNAAPWEGFHNGKPLPTGTYYYIIELNDERFPEPYTGPITIFR